jgi:CRP-like cAMP-binding protein
MELDTARTLPLFAGLSPAALADVMAAAVPVTFAAETRIFWQGNPAAQFFVLTGGKVKLTQVTVDGQQLILRYVSPHQFFGLLSVVAGSLYPVTAETVAPSQALTWSREALAALMEAQPRLAINVLDGMGRLVQEFQDRLRELATERVARRVARALLRLARQTGRRTPEGILLDMPLSRQDLAQLTGATLFTVSRILSEWESQGFVHSQRERIWIVQGHRLVAIAEDLPDSAASQVWPGEAPTAPPAEEEA